MEGTEIKFDVPAVLRKWPSLKSEHISASLGARPYIVFGGTLDECIREFMSKPASQHHLYESPVLTLRYISRGTVLTSK